MTLNSWLWLLAGYWFGLWAGVQPLEKYPITRTIAGLLTIATGIILVLLFVVGFRQVTGL